MTAFDFEPEDAWDATDPPAVQLANLARRIALVDHLNAPRGRSLKHLARVIAGRLERAQRRRDLTPRDRLRLEQLGADLEMVRRRL